MLTHVGCHQVAITDRLVDKAVSISKLVELVYPLTTLSHDQYVSTLVLNGQKDLWHHNENAPLVWRVDGPDTVHVGRIISGVVRRLNVACVLSQLSSTQLV